MKKIFTLALLCSLVTWGFAQENIFPATGNVGVGTLAPEDAIHIQRTVSGPVVFKVDNPGVAGNSHSVFVMKNGGVGDLRMQWVSAGVGTWYMGLDKSDESKLKFAWNNASLVGSHFTIKKSGEVGIGTDNPTLPLSVNGKIESEEIEVVVDVPDYVFEEDYALFSLPQLEQFIQKNKHLPNIQSVSDAQNNRGGYVRLGEFSAGILENLETTILHVIEMNKKIEKLEQENKELTNNVTEQLKLLTGRINQLEVENASLKAALEKK